MIPFLISFLLGMIFGYMWISDPVMGSLYILCGIPLFGIIMFLVGKKNKIFLLIKIFLVLVITVISFLAVFNLSLWHAGTAIQQFECEYAKINNGMAKSDVLQIMGKYVVSDQDGMVMFRSLPQKSKRHFRVKDAYVVLDDDAKVVQKTDVYVPDW